MLFPMLLGCSTPEVPATAPDDTTPPAPTTDDDLAVFYDTYGGREAFPAHQIDALEALLYAQDELAAGDRSAARARIDDVFEAMPLSEGVWRDDVGYAGANIGDPVAYYGLRMLDQILRLGTQPVTDSLTMTAIVAPCASVSRPTLPDLAPETVDLEIDPLILAEDARILHASTALFRSWVEAITGGARVELVVHELSDCTTVTYTDDGSVIVSYPDAAGMVDAVPDDISEQTDFWWVVAPSGVPGDGAGYDRHFITGGMGGYGAGLPLFLSDDAWFTRKPEHLGEGAYTMVELRAYQPQWFQHEFMHHLFRTWPEYGLEDSDHQWFDRTTWPDDFEGVYEPDYYIEAVDKRLLAASPSLAEGLVGPEWAGPASLTIDALVGDYERQPVQNGWHEVTVIDNDGLRWTNADGVSWSLEIRDGALWAGEDCPYGPSELAVALEDDAIATLWFGGEAYIRLD
ncbi:MAG: hypothetical protein P8R54_06950 [Myxococcota bacterium]|nr:hypothetical protein [Myxococcota bacterium]